MTFHDWLKQTCATEQPDEAIIAYHFGLFETPNGYTVYLTGFSDYDPDDPDWAAEDPDFVPAKRDFELPAAEYGNIKWDVAQDKVKRLLEAFVQTDTFKKSFLADATAITLGFDDGDLEVINEMS